MQFCKSDPIPIGFKDMNRRIRLKEEISKLVGIALFLTFMTCCQSVSSSSTTQDVASPSPENSSGKNGQQNSPVEPCIPHMTNARTLRLAGKTHEAANEFQKAIETGCGEIEIRRELGEMYRAKGLFDNAINEYRKLLSLDNKDIRGHWALADIFVSDTKNYQEGLDELLTSEKLLNKKDYAGRRETDKQMGRAYDGLGDVPLAIKYYEDFLKGCSETPEATACKEIKKRILELRKGV